MSIIVLIILEYKTYTFTLGIVHQLKCFCFFLIWDALNPLKWLCHINISHWHLLSLYLISDHLIESQVLQKPSRRQSVAWTSTVNWRCWWGTRPCSWQYTWEEFHQNWLHIQGLTTITISYQMLMVWISKHHFVLDESVFIKYTIVWIGLKGCGKALCFFQSDTTPFTLLVILHLMWHLPAWVWSITLHGFMYGTRCTNRYTNTCPSK